ncbi:hypothetical protein AB0L82_35640 [Nocardia sp. NPDC052001]|uniref:hypothetical protein n=1 Tax=Nocardia sp. NPDC052001 TaxID=3154853 RepID=UPI0034446B6B
MTQPLIVESTEGAGIRDAAQRLHPLFERVAQLYLQRSDVRDLFPEYQKLLGWLRAAPHLDPINRICRIDGTNSESARYRVLEMNAVCPGGVTFVPRMHRHWSTQIDTADVSSAARQRLVEDRLLFARALQTCHREQFGTNARSAFIVTLRGRFDIEVAEMIEDLTALGVETTTVDARAIRLREGLVVDDRGRRADLVYSNLDQLDLITDPDLEHYLDAAVSGQACFVNPLLSQCIIGDKRCLAVLSAPAFATDFDPAERALLEAHIPWTRVLDRHDTALLDHLDANQGRFVLKPANRLGGDGVVIGARTARSAWRAALFNSAKVGGYVAQEYCPLPTVPGHPDLAVGLDTFLFNGQFAGYFARCSTDAVINVTSGGYCLPVIEHA